MTAQIRSSPERIHSDGEQVWIKESTGTDLRLETDSQLSTFALAEARTPVELRPRRSSLPAQGERVPASGRPSPPGVALDDPSALVIEGGDVARIDVHTGTILSIEPGKLPPDAGYRAASRRERRHVRMHDAHALRRVRSW